MYQSHEQWHEVSVPTLITGQLKEALEFEGTSGHLFELEDAVYPVGSAASVDAAEHTAVVIRCLASAVAKSTAYKPCAVCLADVHDSGEEATAIATGLQR